MNYSKILSTSVSVLVLLTLVTAGYLFASFWGGFHVELIAGAQMMILAFGLSAIALALLRLSYAND